MGRLKGYITMAALVTNEGQTPVSALLRTLEELLREVRVSESRRSFACSMLRFGRGVVTLLGTDDVAGRANGLVKLRALVWCGLARRGRSTTQDGRRWRWPLRDDDVLELLLGLVGYRFGLAKKTRPGPSCESLGDDGYSVWLSPARCDVDVDVLRSGSARLSLKRVPLAMVHHPPGRSVPRP